MDLDAAGANTENVGRNEAFSQGTTGVPWNVASSLNKDSAVFNSMVPGKFTAHSVLTPLYANTGGNGMSAEDAGNRDMLGHYMGSVNGVSQQNYEQTALMRMMGHG